MESTNNTIDLVNIDNNTNTHTNTNTNGNKIYLTNMEEVNVYDEHGNVKETFHFPVIQRPIVIEDSLDTETEEEEEEAEKEAEKAEEPKAAEEQQEAEGEEEEEEEAQEAEEKEEEEHKRRRIGEPAPSLANRCADNRSNDLAPLHPAPSITENAQDEPTTEVDPPLDITAPPSPLPQLDPNMDIVAFMEEHGC